MKNKLRSPKQSGPDWSKGLSTGSTLLNLAFSGRPDVGLLPGAYYLFVGDSAAGKTFLALCAMAEAAHSKQYKSHRLIYDDVEGGALMDTDKFFGHMVLDRRRPATVEQFFDECKDDFENGPCIRVLDSNDSLECSADVTLAKKRKTAREKGKDEPGSYGAEKAKRTKQGLRRLTGPNGPLAKHGSILIIISQTIDNLGFGFEKKTRAGGRALRFFAAGEAWFSIKGSIKKTVHDIPRKIGSLLQIQVKKNRQTGREPTVEIPFYPSHGFDDVGACVEYLIKEGHWKEYKGVVDAPEMGHHCKREELIQKIEEAGKEEELRKVVASVWQEIDSACSVIRKRRYE